MESEKCSVDQNCRLLLECDKKNIIVELQAKIKQLEAELDKARTEISEKIEQEALVCPEDVGCVEYIKWLKAELDKIKKLAENVCLVSKNERPQVLRVLLEYCGILPKE